MEETKPTEVLRGSFLDLHRLSVMKAQQKNAVKTTAEGEFSLDGICASLNKALEEQYQR